MRKRGKKGFTLIELLIVIAIIGILAAVLIPNLLRARRAAQQRAAEAYTANVYTAGNAYLAEFIEATSANVTNACGPATTYLPNTTNVYSVNPPGAAVSSCAVAVLDASSISVSVTDIFGNIYNLP